MPIDTYILSFNLLQQILSVFTIFDNASVKQLLAAKKYGTQVLPPPPRILYRFWHAPKWTPLSNLPPPCPHPVSISVHVYSEVHSWTCIIMETVIQREFASRDSPSRRIHAQNIPHGAFCFKSYIRNRMDVERQMGGKRPMRPSFWLHFASL